MNPAILLCALALPANGKADYSLLVKFIEHYRPGYTVVLVNREERALNDAWQTPLTFHDLRVWMVRKECKICLRMAA